MVVQLSYKTPEILILRMMSYGAWVLCQIVILVGAAFIYLYNPYQELHCWRGEDKAKVTCRFESIGSRVSHVYDFVVTDIDGFVPKGQKSIKGRNGTQWLAYKDANGALVDIEGSGDRIEFFLDRFQEFWNDKSRQEETIVNDDRMKLYISGGFFIFFGLLGMYWSLPIKCIFDKRNGIVVLKNGFSVFKTIQLMDIADFKMEDSSLYQTAIILRSGESIELPRGREIPLTKRQEIREVVRHFLHL